MLPPFHIRNLQQDTSRDTIVRINAPYYDDIISINPAATLKYYDADDGDLITLGSSRELTEKLEEPVPLPSSHLRAHLQRGLQPSDYHAFEIDERTHIRRLWQILQSSNIDSVDVTLAQHQDDTIIWSAEKKDRLATFYKRCRADIWSPIAEELGVTWECIDAMHWAMGKEEMDRRTYRRDLYYHSEKSRSSEEIVELRPDPTYRSTSTQQFEDYRVHHFNATRPPQAQLPMPVSNQPAETATIVKASSMDLDRSTSPVIGERSEERLAAWGSRKAQVAGKHLRSRTTAVDNHRNRLENSKPATSAFPSASTSLSPAFDGSGLTLEGKRQAQIAGDKLRWRTNLSRHSRPSRVGALERAISKNRWSSYGGTRAARFDERLDTQDIARDTLSSADNEAGPDIGQPSLLEVFEAELAKKTSATLSEKALGVESPAVQNSLPKPAPQVNLSSQPQSQRSPQRPQALLGLIDEQLQEPTAGEVAVSQDFSTAIDRSLRGLGSCVQGIARGLQEVTSVSLQATDRTRSADLQLIDDAVLGFQSLTGTFITALGRRMAANRPGVISAPHSESERVETGSSIAPLGISDDKAPKDDAINTRKSSKYPLNGGDDPSKMANSPGPKHATASKNVSEEAAGPQVGMESQLRSARAPCKVTPFHKPGPLRLPNRPGYVDHLRQSQSVEFVDEQCDSQCASSPPLDTHFRTLAQFEGGNFGVGSTSLALPSMQPLAPQQAPSQNMYDIKAQESGSPDENLPLVNRLKSTEGWRWSHDRLTGHYEHSTQRDGHEVIPLGHPSSAARLAEPFDPLEAEPSAQPHLTEGLRRNSTIANTDIRRAARRRRPYSEVFDGSGRIPWNTFLQDDLRERRGFSRASDNKGSPLGAKQEHATRTSRPEKRSQRSPPIPTGYQDQHHEDSTVGKINDCVEQLRDLGFGGKDSDSAGRLLVYAQAADGVLVDAIDMIDEEQRAWQRL